MNLKENVHDWLASIGGVTDAVAAADIYIEVADSGATVPYITIAQISTDHEHHMGGASGLAQARMQIDVWADSETNRNTVSEALRDAFDGYSGTMGDDSVNVRSVFLAEEAETYEPPTDGSQQGVYRNRMDFTIWYVESVPSLS